jgi:hypothetical protein
MKSAHFVCICLMLAGTFALAQNPVPFVNQPLVPDATAPGGPGFTLTVNGTGFVSGATVNWNGAVLATTFVSGSQLTATVPAGDIATAGTASVTVVNPAPGGGASNVQYLSVTKATAPPAFAPAVAYGSGGYGALAVAVADVNGDGKLDLLVANECATSCAPGVAGSVSVLLGNGDGTFQPAVSYASGGYHANSVVVADVNGDGKPDLLVANFCSDSACLDYGTIGVLLGNGDGTFQTAMTFQGGGGYVTSLAVADVNRDGKPDVVAASSENAAVLLGNGDGTFQTGVNYYADGDQASSIAVADLNADGKLDLVVVMRCDGSSCSGPGPISVLLGNGDGTFHLAAEFSSGYFVTVADVNGDGKPDLLLADIVDNSANVLLGNGDGTFQGVVEYPPGGLYPYSIAVADVNGDGKPDLVVAIGCVGPCGTSGGTGVLLGNGDGTFQRVASFGSGGVSAQSVAVADVNGDGKLDLLVANCGVSSDYSSCLGESSSTIGVLINNGKPGTTTSLASLQNPSNFGQAATFTATVTAPGGGAPTGTVSFFDGTTKIGNSNLNGSAVASLTTSTLAEGTHSITATYNGDANFAISTSPVLDQVVEGATVTLSPASLNFGAQTAGITSAPQVVMLTNTGAMPLILTSIGISGTNSGDFAQTNNCPSSIAPNGGCNISVKFTPTAGGNRTAAVSIADNAPGSPQDVPLTGIVPDFSVTANSPTSQTVTPGQAANFVVTVTPLNGFAETVSLSCGGAPAQSTCAVTPSSVILNGSSTVAVNVAVVTAGVSTALRHPPQLPRGMRWALGLALSPVAGLVVLGGLGSMRRHRHLFRPLALLAIFSASLTWPACGGGGGHSSGGGTPTGTYTLTVTGIYGSGSTTLSHATTVTLIVQ